MKVWLKFDENQMSIMFVVEISDEIFALLVGDVTVDSLVDGIIDLGDIFVGHLCLYVHL